MQNEKLRLGIMCRGSTFPAWQALCIQELVRSGLVEIVLIIEDDARNDGSATLAQKLKRIGVNRALFETYLRTIYRPKSSLPVDLATLLDHVPRRSCVVEKRGKWSQHFSDDDLQAIRAQKLDLILRFGFNIIRGEILQAAKFGVWSFHHDDELRYRGGPPCFWEIYHQDPTTGSILQRLTDRLDGGIVLRRGNFRTKAFSYARNVDQAYFESAYWPAQVCRDIANRVTDAFAAPPTVTDAPVYRAPTNRQFAVACWRMACAVVGRGWFRLARLQSWNVAILRTPIADLIGSDARALRATISAMLPVTNRHTFNADSFGIPIDEGFGLLFEELDASTGGVGRIIAARVGRDGQEIKRTPAAGIPSRHHTSYPYVWRGGEHVYMLPETGAAGTITLLRATSFPESWEPVAELLSGENFIDPTLIRHDGLYWLFYTVHDARYDGDLHLHIAFSERLEGPYSRHPANPVKTSARSARPGGTPFIDRQGRLIRPAQNFCRTYGGSIVFNRVDLLTPERFSEEEVGELLPFDPYYKDGLHTIAALDEQHVVVDMKRHVTRWPWRRR